MSGGIYYITNPEGKLYIGSTTNFERRQRDYKNGKCKKQRKLFNSIWKYGWKNHEFVEWICTDNLQQIEQNMLCLMKPELNVCEKAGLPPHKTDNWKKAVEARKVAIVRTDKDGNVLESFDSIRTAQKAHGGRIWQA
jgi:group I intron endonuclease